MGIENWNESFGLPTGGMVRFSDTLTPLSPCPDAVEELERLLERLAGDGTVGETRWAWLESPHLVEALVRLAYGAPFLVRHLARNPDALRNGLLDDLAAGLTPGGDKPVEGWAGLRPWNDYRPGGDGAPVDEGAMMLALRRWKYDNYVRLTARDLLELCTTAQTCRAIAWLAEEMIEQAYRFAFENLVAKRGLPMTRSGRAGLGAVIGMGKLGGRELNFSSDVDVIFIHGADDIACRPLHDFNPPPLNTEDPAVYWKHWQTAAGQTGEPKDYFSGGEFHNQLARQVVRLVGTNTGDGFGFRVDVDLRPQGKSGLLAPGMTFLHQYYDTQGREWERTAMLKARCVAGCRETWQQFDQVRAPFVYRRYLDFSAVEGIALIKHDINRNHREVLTDNLKLGQGGIRENEFFIQAMQLLWWQAAPAAGQQPCPGHPAVGGGGHSQIPGGPAASGGLLAAAQI